MSDEELVGKFGWKLHVSTQPQSETKIAKLVLPYLKNKDIYFKTCQDLRALRTLNGDLRTSYTQQGKFITIYTEYPNHAKKLSNDLDKTLSDA